jgi:hypothetical protein
MRDIPVIHRHDGKDSALRDSETYAYSNGDRGSGPILPREGGFQSTDLRRQAMESLRRDLFLREPNSDRQSGPAGKRRRKS